MYFPPEWHEHAAVWLAWPSHPDLWLDAYRDVQSEVLGLARAIADCDPATGQPRGEALHVLACGSAQVAEAQAALEPLGATIYDEPFGDIWLRDTGPLFLRDSLGEPVAIGFRFNGWGGKYLLDYDDSVAERIALQSGVDFLPHPWTLEGGAIDHDGEGTLLTTRQCLLNPNRNPDLSQADIEAKLQSNLGIEQIIWLGDGLQNDHTDGHVDNLARFVAPGTVVCMEPSGPDDPNREALLEAIATLKAVRDAKGRAIKVLTIPSPGRVEDEEGELMAASYVNFYISNTRVIVPQYGSPFDGAAVVALQAIAQDLRDIWGDREVIGLPAKNILQGGGSFHCISQQQPR
ncbi:agmatine deiminase family protein [Limnothrix sp. FACHB-881]|uniref:agmatine deiminase family protein n=1 Tax=Limnothrix sp. FACHB-881 TaxID=2692819 RepID=UPI0016869B3D|nr:agmatine deiminase family protein [Limnothrix sp. FACHB-881]MBD2636458.1 agmatine deiminase family protein [Limnothrix sp. FACHB-881]